MFTSHEDLSEHVCEETHNEITNILTEILRCRRGTGNLCIPSMTKQRSFEEWNYHYSPSLRKLPPRVLTEWEYTKVSYYTKVLHLMYLSVLSVRVKLSLPCYFIYFFFSQLLHNYSQFLVTWSSEWSPYTYHIIFCISHTHGLKITWI